MLSTRNAAQWLYEHLIGSEWWWSLPVLRRLARALDRRNERRIMARCPPRILIIDADGFRSEPLSKYE